MLKPSECFCGHCGAEPGYPCRKPNGQRVVRHKARGNPNAPSKPGAFDLACWTYGFEAGVNRKFTRDMAERVSSQLISPRRFMEGWTIGRNIREKEHEKARRKYMYS